MPGAEDNPIVALLDEIKSLLRQLVAKERPKSRRLLRLSEGAEYLHVSPGHLRSIIQSGDLQRVQPNGNDRAPWLLDRADLDDWITRHKV